MLLVPRYIKRRIADGQGSDAGWPTGHMFNLSVPLRIVSFRDDFLCKRKHLVCGFNVLTLLTIYVSDRTMALHPLDFEKPILELQRRLEEIREHSGRHDVDLRDARGLLRLSGCSTRLLRALSPAPTVRTDAIACIPG